MPVFVLFLLLVFSSFAYDTLPEKRQYIEPMSLKTIPIFPMDKISWKRRATPVDINLINQYYRHPSIVDKVQSKNYININFIYALPAQSTDYAKHLSGNTPLINAAITDFIVRHDGRNFSLNKRSFGFSAALGSQLSYDVKGEFEIMFFQSAYIYNQYNATLASVGANPTIQIRYRENGVDVIAAFDNGEYIRRNISVHYNLQKEFPDILKGNSDTFISRMTPFVIGGIGLTSRTHLLRLSSGVLGNGNTVASPTSTQNFLNIFPSLNLGLGIRYKINDTIAFNIKANTIQVVNNWNFSNVIIQTGIVIFL